MKQSAQALKTLYARTRGEWRAWLARHHDRAEVVWLVYYKAHTGKPRVAYDDAVEEALCFGWIDSIVRRLDDERYAQKFTPRRPGSSWSDSNRRRVKELVRRGLMTPAGLRTLADKVARSRPPPSREVALAPELEEELRANERACRFFGGLAPSYRRLYVRWIMSAKRAATRTGRVREAIRLLAAGKKLGLK
jgi:uncharacterized protein YdeI (YjbR/CyaY-like superfamily)